MSPHTQSLMAMLGVIMVSIGLSLILLKNKERFKFGMTLFGLGAVGLIMFLRRTPDFEVGFNGIILMGMIGVFYYGFYPKKQRQM